METILNKIINDYLIRLNELKVIKECYEKRLHLVKFNYVLKNEYEKNEVDILSIKTIHTIRLITEKISEIEDEFQENYGRMIEELKFTERELV